MMIVDCFRLQGLKAEMGVRGNMDGDCQSKPTDITLATRANKLSRHPG